MTPDQYFAELPALQSTGLSQGALSFREIGEGRPFVFLHGLNGSSQSWGYQFAQFADRFRVIAWDAPGYGESDPVEPTIQAYADTLHEFLTVRNCTNAILVGHSMGGMIATRAAAKPRSMIARLVLSCTHAGPAGAENAPISRRYTDRVAEREKLGPDAYGQVRAFKMMPPDASALACEIAARIVAGEDLARQRNAYRMLQSTDNREVLPELAIPMLIISGGRDPVVPAERLEELLALCPAATHSVIESAGHAPYIEAGNTYNARVGAFADTD